MSDTVASIIGIVIVLLILAIVFTVILVGGAYLITVIFENWTDHVIITNNATRVQ